MPRTDSGEKVRKIKEQCKQALAAEDRMNSWSGGRAALARDILYIINGDDRDG